MTDVTSATPGGHVPSVDAPAHPPTRLPRYRDTPRQRGRFVLVVVFALVAVAGVVGIALFAARAGDASGAGLSVLYALIPLPLLWFVYWWLDRYEPEPRRYKFAAFVWGAVVAVAIALVLEGLAATKLGLGDATMASVVAPVVEEPAKCLFLLLTFARWRRVLDGYLDGIIMAGIVGLGFAFSENIGYYAASYLGSPDLRVAGAEGATGTFIVRGVFSPFAHPLFTTAFGLGLGLAVATRSRWLKVLATVGGLLASIALHALWNGSLSYAGGVGFVLAYLLLAGLFVGLAVFAIVIRVRQVRDLETSLSYVAERGWIHPAEIPYLSRFHYRTAARRYARRHHGAVAAKVVRRYQRLATEMAFLHDRVMRGQRVPHGVDRTYALLDALYALRPGLRLPPALRPIGRH